MAKGKVGKVLKNLRLKAGLSQKQAYEYIGVAQSTFSSWEVGKAEPPIEVVLDLCELYKVGDVLKAFGYDGYDEEGSGTMLLGDVVKKYREDHKMTMQEFADASGLSKGYISMLEKNRHPQSKRKLSPSLGTYKKVADAMCISLDDLISMIDEDSSVKINTDDNSHYHRTEGSEFTVNEIDIIEKYRTLDNYGQKIINLILDEEVERCTPSEPLLEPISIAYYHQLASAGQGEYIFDDLPTDTIRICRTAEAENADFVLRVRGDSMEPTISDGDLLLIQKTPELKIGDIGIFIDQHDCYVKELGADGLISHNRKYPLITSASGVMCVGKVLGKAEPLNS